MGPPEAIGFKGTELQEAINNQPGVLETFETIRAHGAVKMGLIDLLVRALSIGKLHHAMIGTHPAR